MKQIVGGYSIFDLDNGYMQFLICLCEADFTPFLHLLL